MKILIKITTISLIVSKYAKKDYYKSKLQSSAKKFKAITSVIHEILSKKRKVNNIKKIKTPSGQYTNDPREIVDTCLLYTSPSPRDTERSRMPSSA